MDTTKNEIIEEKRRILALLKDADPKSDDYAILIERLEDLDRVGTKNSDTSTLAGDILKASIPAIITGAFSLAINVIACRTSIGLVSMKAVEEASGEGVVPQWQTKFIPSPKIGK